MFRTIIILLFFVSTAMPAMSHRADSLILHILATQILPNDHSMNYCSYTTYEKSQLSFYNPESAQVNGKPAYQGKWLKAILDATGSDFLPIMTDQRLIRTYWRKHPEKEVNEVLGINREGLNEILGSDDYLDLILARKYHDFTIYDDTIYIEGEKRISPIGVNCHQYYDYVVKEDRGNVLTIAFAPRPNVDEDLVGTIKLVKEDDVWYIRQTHYIVRKSASSKNLNGITITQDYDLTSQGRTELVRSDLTLEMGKLGVFGRVRYRDVQVCFDYSIDTIPDKRFRFRSKLKYSSKADYRGPEFWKPYDQELANTLMEYKREDSLYYDKTVADSTGVIRRRQTAVQEYLSEGLDYLGNSRRGMKILTSPVKALVNNFIEVGNPPVFDIEPVYSFISYNKEDRFRFRVGGQTTANLFKRVFFAGYLAYGSASKNIYYKAKALYSLLDKEYEPFEFPRRSVSIESQYDICYLGERNNHVDHDNLFKSIQWNNDGRLIYYNMQKLELEFDQSNGVGYVFSLKRERDIANRNLYFHTLHEANVTGYSSSTWPDNGAVCTTELIFKLVYVPASKRFYSRKKQMPINTELPNFDISHRVGVNMLGGHYTYHLTELQISKDWFLGVCGIGTTTFKAGGIWNQAPYPLLLAPPANLSFIADESSFYLMRPFEFVNDRYVQWLLSLETNGNIIGKIPFIKKLRWKEFVALRMLWGTLTDKNNPTLARNADSDILMALPRGTSVMNEKVPYVEGAVGIHNIFHVLNIDYIYRFSYTDYPNCRRSGLRFSVHFDL